MGGKSVFYKFGSLPGQVFTIRCKVGYSCKRVRRKDKSTYFFPRTDVTKHVAAGIKRSPRMDRITMNR